MFTQRGWTVPRATRVLIAAITTTQLLTSSVLLSQDTTRVPNVTLLRRIAEAVDGRRTGQLAFVVANADSAIVAAVVPTRDEAASIVRRLGAAFQIFGPFREKTDPVQLRDLVVASCVHDGRTSQMRAAICNGRPIRFSEIAAMSLVLRMQNGSSRTIELPTGTDAIFLSYPAYDKFVFPYYERVIGLEATAAMRERMLRGLPPQ